MTITVEQIKSILAGTEENRPLAKVKNSPPSIPPC